MAAIGTPLLPRECIAGLPPSPPASLARHQAELASGLAWLLVERTTRRDVGGGNLGQLVRAMPVHAHDQLGPVVLDLKCFVLWVHNYEHVVHNYGRGPPAGLGGHHGHEWDPVGQAMRKTCALQCCRGSPGRGSRTIAQAAAGPPLG
jgi:hypothetical protein